MEILFFEVWRGSTKVKETRYAGPLTAENALGALQAENPLYRGKLTVKDGDVGLTGPHSLDSSRTYVLQLADLAGASGSSAGAQFQTADVTDASARDEKMDRLLQGFEVMMKKFAANSVDMSSAGCSVAEEVLRELGFMQIDSSMLPDASPPQLLPEFENYPAFSMHAYPDEPAATGPYVKYLQKALQYGTVTMGKGGMAVSDIRKEVFLKLHGISATFNGFMDVGVHPAHVMGASILDDLEAGVEFKHTQEQKKMYRADQADLREPKRPRSEGVPEPSGDEAESEEESTYVHPGATGLNFAARVKGEAILEVLACFAVVRKKVALYLTDGVKYHRLTLTDDQLLYHLDLDVPAALSFMVQDIKQKGTAPLLHDTAAGPLKRLRQQGESALLGQLDTALAFTETPGERFQTAFELIHAHGQSSKGLQRLPKWLEYALS